MKMTTIETPTRHTETAPAQAGTAPSASDRVLIGLTHGAEEPENVLIAYLMGVEALRAGKDAVMWLTKNGVDLIVDGFADTVEVPGAPSIADLHDEYVDRGGRFFGCRVCVKLRGHEDAALTTNASVVGAPDVYEYTTGGALVFNY
jgi:predicted peroxiredoxin